MTPEVAGFIAGIYLVLGLFTFMLALEQLGKPLQAFGLAVLWPIGVVAFAIKAIFERAR